MEWQQHCHFQTYVCICFSPFLVLLVIETTTVISLVGFCPVKWRPVEMLFVPMHRWFEFLSPMNIGPFRISFSKGSMYFNLGIEFVEWSVQLPSNMTVGAYFKKTLSFPVLVTLTRLVFVHSEQETLGCITVFIRPRYLVPYSGPSHLLFMCLNYFILLV